MDSAALSLQFAKLSDHVAANLKAEPPVWLKKRQLQQIFLHGELSCVLVSNKMIRTINKQWRDQDKATDVLSFPLELTQPPWLHSAKSGSVSRSRQSLDFDQEEAQQPWVVGELIISLERAQEQAIEYGHSLERELSFLFVHGLLHILGFDHMTKADEKVMFGRQRHILDAAGIKRK